MAVIKTNYSNNNQVLTKLLVAKKEPGAWVNMPNRAFTDGKEVTYKIYNLMTGKDIDPNGTFALISFDENGSFKRFYPPCVYATSDGLAIKWGDEFIPVKLEEGLSIPNSTLKLSIAEDKLGNFNNICLIASWLDVGNKLKYSMSFPCRLNDMRQDIEEVKMFVEMNDGSGLVNLFSAPPAAKSDISKLSTIPENGDVVFETYETLTLKDGRVTFILITELGEKYWANDSIVNLVDAGAKFPLSVSRFVNEKGKNRYTYEADFPEEDEGDDLEWLLTQ